MGSAGVLDLDLMPARSIELDAARMKNKVKKRASTKLSITKTAGKRESDAMTTISSKEKKRSRSANSEEPLVSRKMPKRAAACSNFKEKSVCLSEESSVIDIKQDLMVEDEVVAIRLTEIGLDDSRPSRRLLDFTLHDVDGVPKQFEMSELDDLYISALVMPLEESSDKGKGVRCEGFGRIESWTISGYEEGSPVIWISTELADYDCIKPASSYKRYYDYFFEKARACIEVFKKLSISCVGNSDMSLEELLAGVVRSMSGSKFFPGGTRNMDFLISLGDFIYNQLIGLDETSKKNDVVFTGLPVLLALREECKKRGEFTNTVFDGCLKIMDGKKLDNFGSPGGEVEEDEDEKLARILQEEEYWKSMKKTRCSQPTSKKFYVKINEDEIANDYPLPAYYKTSVQEMDEYVFFDSDTSMQYPDELPRRMLHNWSLYNSDSRLISLELLPMRPCAEVDVTIFGSGTMTEDDGSAFCFDADPTQCTSSSLETSDTDGIPIYLSAIKEWMIEFGSSMVFISIRTDVAWYRLGKPSKQYDPWYLTVLRTARLAISIITLLKEQSRVSKLSFADVIKKISEFETNHPAHISSTPASTERYVVVHGQIILQQFAEYPDEVIRKSAFVSGLSERMELRHHTKLIMKKKIMLTKQRNLNPRALMEPSIFSKRKTMKATTTRLINRIWSDYYSNYLHKDSKDHDHESNEEDDVEEERNEEADADEERILVNEKVPRSYLTTRPDKLKVNEMEIGWAGESTGKKLSGEKLYKCAKVRGDEVNIGGAVMVDSDESEDMHIIIFVEYMFERLDGGKMVHGRVLQRGCHTILGNAANEREVFLTNECIEFGLEDIKQTVVVNIRSLPWGHEHRKENATADKLERERAEERKSKGFPIEYYCKNLYWPERGAFFTLPTHNMGLGMGVCHSCEAKQNQAEFKLESQSSFIYNNIKYFVHEFVYVSPQNFSSLQMDTTFKSGRNVGLRPYVVCELLEIDLPKGSKEASLKSTSVKLRRFYRPEDISITKAYSSDIREIYYSDEILRLPVESIEGKCEVRKKHDLPSLTYPVIFDHIFFCEYIYDPAKGSLKQLPSNIKLKSPSGKPASRKSKGKLKEGECDPDDINISEVSQDNRLATLDIFAGCGGLSEGLQNSGVSFTKWAIEYEQPAAEAFSLNHPDALLFVENCNVILRAIMEKCGDIDDCISTSEASELAAKLGEENIKNLPVPGQVDFINGGPPCQGFSGMNRFNQSTWSKVQCEMILAFLSFADYFRPKYFLLENVRNFVCFNKGQTFRLTLASLLEMGYQVRFGALEAGAYGVPQSRKRAFIWAAAPTEALPEWPEPMYVFSSPALKISLTDDMQYAAVRSTVGGAPFRSITVRDTIGDLPSVGNGASNIEMSYSNDPISWFQKQIRGSMSILSDHISKEMNELNCMRCQRIPKRPGADWHDLPDEKVKLSTGQMVDLIPWCLPNTAKRHNQWKGLFGRLDWEGNFPTSITDPQPMGKVGMCFHPDQDRIVTARECARSQGFLDSYKFSGNIQSKHKQIGNAVPPPLALALGRKLKEAVDRNRSS